MYNVDDYAMNREERIAIMTICGNVPEAEAQAYCDTRPDIYGKQDWFKTEKQEVIL